MKAVKVLVPVSLLWSLLLAMAISGIIGCAGANVRAPDPGVDLVGAERQRCEALELELYLVNDNLEALKARYGALARHHRAWLKTQEEAAKGLK